jgi:hypothetical protein
MNWTAEQATRLLSYREQYPESFDKVARSMADWYDRPFTKDACQKKYQTLRAESAITQLSDLLIPDMMPNFHRHFDEAGRPYLVAPKADWTNYLYDRAVSGDRVELLHVGDLHVPLHDDRLLDRVLRRHRAADLLVVAGDALDIYGFSRFPKARNIPLEREIEEWCRIQDFIAGAFPHVVIIGSNHLDRINRVLTDQVPMSLRFLLEPDLLGYLAQPYANVHVLPDWYVAIGDCIFAHGDHSGGLAPKSAWDVWDKISTFMRAGHFPKLEIRCVVQAHTHHIGTAWDVDVKLIEPGCLAKLPLEYTVAANSVRFKKPQQNGYASIIQRYGRTLLNESREYVLEATDDDHAPAA